MNIGLDLDSTLVNMGKPMEKEINKKFNCNFKRSDIKDWNWSTFPKEIKDYAFGLYSDDKFMNSFRPFPRVQLQLYKWCIFHNLYIITARHKNIRENTIKMILNLFPMLRGLYHDIYFVDYGKSKSKLMKDLKLDVWIDDSPNGVKDSLKLDIKTYLISNNNTQYNWEARKLPNINIVKSVKDIVL